LKAKMVFKKNCFSLVESKKLLKILNPAVESKKKCIFSAIEPIKRLLKSG